nr:integrase, catalytic region, zinc finger, CCHC-type, peptidase aspartic, catalytic [Tanacetum cinerariifolium]
VDVVSLVPKLRKNRTAHIDYIRHTQEEAATIRELVESERLLSLLDTSLAYAFKRKVWKSTGKVFKTIGYIWKPTGWTFTLVGNVCPLTRIATATIVPPREPIPIVKSTDKPVVTLVVQIVLWYLDSGCSKHMTEDHSQLINFVQKFLGTVKFGNDHVAKIIGRTFTLVGNVCPLTRIATATIVPHREPIPIVKSMNKPVVTLVVQIVLWYLDSGCSKHMTGDRSQLINFVQKFLGTVKFRNDHVAKIMGYGDYQIRNVTISRVYYVEGLGHNLFSVGQFCDSDLEVAFRKHTCFIRNLKGVGLLTGSRGNNLYTLPIQDMMASSPICLLSKASKTKSWL